MTDHVVNVEPVARETGTGGAKVPPAYRYRCTCGARGEERVAKGLGTAKANEAREDARRDAIRHQREAAAIARR